MRLSVQEGIETIAIPMARELSPFQDLVAFFRLWHTLRELRPDLTEFSTPKAGLLGSLAAFLCRVPSRVYLLRGLKLETSHGWKRRLLCMAEQVTAACSHQVICNSRSLLKGALELGLVPECKLRLLGEGSSHGVDVDHFAPGTPGANAALREEYNLPEDAPVIGFVGRLTRDKGVPELIEAFDAILNDLPDARLLLVGWFDSSEDALEPRLRHYIELHPAILRTGFVPDTAPWYRIMDVMVFPTWREGFPNVVLEAAATGVPVVTTLATGSRDAVVPEVTGLLVPPGYPEALREAMLALLRNSDRRRKMGQAARKWVVENFTEKNVLAHTISLYRALLRQGGEDSSAVLASDAATAEVE
jgi:glycosyltransferase involved in cell wall biosynthesis